MPELTAVSKPVLVGEANPYGGDPHFALYPAPDGCSGHRLCCLILGMTRHDYLESFERVNLCPHEWRLADAVRKADSLASEGKHLVLLGAKVCRVFGVPFTPFDTASGFPTKVGALVLPHPSGLSRAWNSVGSYQRARESLAVFVPHLVPLLGKYVKEG